MAKEVEKETAPTEPLLQCSCPKKEMKKVEDLGQMVITNAEGSKILRFCKGDNDCMAAVNKIASQKS